MKSTAKQIKTQISIGRVSQPSQSDANTKDPPKIAVLMATAIRFEEMIHAGFVSGYSELAQTIGFSRARITQIMNLRLLATPIQEELLDHTNHQNKTHKITERKLRPIMDQVDWSTQMKLWHALRE